jgi:hypothetical protein
MAARYIAQCIHHPTKAFKSFTSIKNCSCRTCLTTLENPIWTLAAEGLTSVIHQEKLGSSPTLCDVVDIRHALAQSLPFFLVPDDTLPFGDNSFESTYIQFADVSRNNLAA